MVGRVDQEDPNMAESTSLNERADALERSMSDELDDTLNKSKKSKAPVVQSW